MSNNVRVGLVRVEDCELHPHNVRRDRVTCGH